MIALDTNVLVRFLTADDKRQAARAKALYLALSASATGFASFDDAWRKKATVLGISPTVTAP